MIRDPLRWIVAEAAAWSARGLSRSLRPIDRDEPAAVEREGRRLVNYASNDYLGLASDPRVIEAAVRAARRGWGAGASPLVAGWTLEHEGLAREIAAFEGAEAAVLFPTGYAANLGTIAALVGKPDVVYSDRLNHACLIDGSRLSGATIRIYPHRDADALAALLAADSGAFRRSLIVTDGVFSMDGDLAPIGRLADLADEHGAMLLVDEAHGTGVLGPDGRGAASELGAADRVTVRVGTLSKALASIGGFVAGPSRLIDWLTNAARPLIFSTAAPPASVAAARAALGIVRDEPWRRDRVRGLAARLRSALGIGRIDDPPPAPIVPIPVGDAEAAVAAARLLADRGFLVPAIRPPTVPEGTSRLRISLSAAHSDGDVDALCDAIRAIGLGARG